MWRSPHATPAKVVANFNRGHGSADHVKAFDHRHRQRDGIPLHCAWKVVKLGLVNHVPAAVPPAMEYDVSSGTPRVSNRKACRSHVTAVDQLMASSPMLSNHGAPQPVPGIQGTQGSSGPARPTSRIHSPSTS